MFRYSKLRSLFGAQPYDSLNEGCKTLSFSSNDEDVEEEEGLIGLRQSTRKPFRTWFISKCPASISLHSILLGTNILFFVVYTTGWLFGGRMFDPQHAETIFRDVIKFEERYFDPLSTFLSDGSLNTHKKTTKFNGPPRPEYEEAWAKLMIYENIRVEEEDLGQYAGQKSLVKLSDGSGYYMGVSVFHALHCVQRLHHYVYRDHYHPNLSEADSFALQVHTDHCLDWLRQYVQCNADTTLIPTRWAEYVPRPVVEDWGMRTCVSWEPIMEFMKARSFNPFEPGLLMHPTFGDPYNNSHSSGVGSTVLPDGHTGLLGGDRAPKR